MCITTLIVDIETKTDIKDRQKIIIKLETNIQKTKVNKKQKIGDILFKKLRCLKKPTIKHKKYKVI